MSITPPLHRHSLADLPVGPGANNIPTSASIRSGLIAIQSASSSAVASSMVLTAFGGTGAYTLPANTLRANEVLRVRMLGTIGITGTPTLLLSLAVGGLVRGASAAGAVVAGNWTVDLEITQLAAAAARMRIAISATTTTTQTLNALLYDVQGLDPTVDNVIQMSAQWSAADPANTTTQVYRTVERLAIFDADTAS